MRTIIALTLGALLFCSGCEQEAEKHAVQPETRPQFSVDLATAHVDIMNCDHNVLENGRSVRMNLRVTYSDGLVRERILNMATSRVDSDAGYAATLLDTGATPIVNVTQRWGGSTDSTVRYFLSEATPTDQLELRSAIRGSRVHESYILNGTPFDADYVRSTTSEQEARTAFAKFYSPFGIPKTAFAGNVDASVMMQLIADQGFAAWLTGSPLPSIPYQPAPKVQCTSVGCICSAATVCAIISCAIGEVFDPVCDVCGAVSVLCFIASWFTAE